MTDWLTDLAYKAIIPLISLLLAGAAAWGAITVRMANVEVQIERIENKVDWIMRYLASG